MTAWELMKEYKELGEKQLEVSAQISREPNKEVVFGLFRQQDQLLVRMTEIKHKMMKVVIH